MRGSTALFMTRTPPEYEIRDLYDDWITLTVSNTWNPDNLSCPCEINITNNASAVHLMKEDVPCKGLRVCATMERDTGYIEGSGDYCLLSGTSTALTNKSVLPRTVNSVKYITNTTSRNRHCDIFSESLSEKFQIGINTAQDTLKISTQQGI